MKAPAGLNLPPNMVLKLRKALYRLKQAARAWSTSLELFLYVIGFIPSNAGRRFFLSIDPNVESFILVYVDDIIICGKDKAKIEEVVKQISQNMSQGQKNQSKNIYE